MEKLQDTYKEIEKKTEQQKLEILKKANNHLDIAFKNKDSAMVVAIAELIKNN
ncbi:MULTISPECIES: hypothetical protein [Latilactobacillus]|uniref:hypothetical protein n=1 Tax=Latilactobacillus TaxID=2767885 RepID=UPI00217D7A09|nr:hypothetical protein [Latilactobacillus curvatus]